MEQMWDAVTMATPGVAPWVALIVSVITGFFGVRGFLLSRKIYRELKSDEELIPGVLHNPSLSHPEHENCVIQTTIFNKSRRKAYVSSVRVFDGKGDEIEISWSDHIDQYGNPQGNSQMIGIVDSISLCIRRNDGAAFREARVEVKHSFDNKPMILDYTIARGWPAYFAK